MQVVNRATIFDKDGTLVDTESFALRKWVESAQKFEIPLTEAGLLKYHGMDRPTINRGLAEDWRDFTGPGTATARLLAEAGAQTLVGGGVDPSEAVRIIRALRDQAMVTGLTDGSIPTMPGFDTLEQFLRRYSNDRDPILIGMATNDPTDAAWMFLNRFGVADLFKVVVGADKVARPKPHPDLILTAARELQTDLDKVVVVEDTLIGLEAALAARAKCIVIPGRHETDFSWTKKATAVCRSLEEIPDTMLELHGLRA